MPRKTGCTPVDSFGTSGMRNEDPFLNLIRAEIAKGPMKEFPQNISVEEELRQTLDELIAYVESRLLEDDHLIEILNDPIVIQLVESLNEMTPDFFKQHMIETFGENCYIDYNSSISSEDFPVLSVGTKSESCNYFAHKSKHLSPYSQRGGSFTNSKGLDECRSNVKVRILNNKHLVHNVHLSSGDEPPRIINRLIQQIIGI